MRFDKSFLEVNSRKCACLYSSFKGTFCLCPTCIPFPSFLPSFLRDLLTPRSGARVALNLQIEIIDILAAREKADGGRGCSFYR